MGGVGAAALDAQPAAGRGGLAGNGQMMELGGHLLRGEGQLRLGQIRHHIGLDACLDLKLGGELPGKMHLQDPLFAVYQGIVRIRGKGQIRQLFHLGVMVHAAPAALLVAAQQHPDPPAEFGAAVLHRGQGKQGGYRRALIVHHAPAIDAAVLDKAFIGREAPAVAGGHHIQVGQHAQLLFPFPGLRIAHIAIQILGGQAQLFRQFHGGCQAILDCRAKGRTWGGFSLGAGEAHQGL